MLSPLVRPLVRHALTLAIIGGIVLAVWPLGQYTYATWNQRELLRQWQATAISPHPAPKAAHISRQTKARPKVAASSIAKTSGRHDSDSPALATVSLPASKQTPWPLTKLSIPDIGLEIFVVQGMDAVSLRRGPGHDSNSSSPGEGNCVIAGHRNVYGSYFYRLDELNAGATIRLENSKGTYEYIADVIYTTPDTNLTVVQPPPAGNAPLLTLITCTLPHTNNRLVLQAHLAPPQDSP